MLAKSRYAFVTQINNIDASRMGEPGVENNSSLLVADMETFLRHTMTEEAELPTVEDLIKYWNSYLSDVAMETDAEAGQPLRILVWKRGGN